jgi:hypothetical protein
MIKGFLRLTVQLHLAVFNYGKPGRNSTIPGS